MPASVTLLTDRRESCPYGAPLGPHAGSPGSAGPNTLHRADGTVEILSSKVRIELAPGDRPRIETPGGGSGRSKPA